MGFLRRLLGGEPDSAERSPEPDASATPERSPRGVDDDLPDDEVERERTLLRADAERLDNELIQRQLRYADRAWTPPAQGSDRRADDRVDRSG